jgi:predicted kinase
MTGGRFPAVDRVLQTLGPLPGQQTQPALVVISGLPGTGKSRFANDLRHRTGAVILESDAVRRLLFERPSYTWQESRRLFTVIHATIEQLLREGISVIFDATNLAERYRRPLYQIAGQCGAKLILVEVTAPAEVAMARLAERAAAGGSLSDADVAVYERMLPTWEEIGREHFVVDTSKPTNAAVEAIAREMKDRASGK